MNNNKICMPQLTKTVCLLAATLLLGSSVKAQKTAERVKNDSIAARYKDEHAVYTNYAEKLVIKQDDEDGSLAATAYVTMDKLLISDLSTTMHNADFFEFSDLNGLRDVNCTSYIPDKKGGYTRETKNFGFGLYGQISGSFYDDRRQIEAYYTSLPKGTLTETKYALENTDIAFLPGFTFSTNIPVVSAKFEVEAPEYVHLEFAVKNADAVHIKQDKETKNGKTTYTFTASNLRPAKYYNLVPSTRYYLAHIIPYIKSYRLPGAKKDSVILRDADALAYHNFAYVKDLNIRLDTPLARISEEITKNDKSDREKAVHIYNWVQNHIHYIAFEAGMQGFIPRPADTVYKRMYGDCKDMASMCMGMCRHVGVKAYFATIGTREIPYAVDEVPTSCFDHMICAVKLGDDWVFLDGTDNIQPFGTNRWDIQGKEAFIFMDAKHYKIVKIPVVAEDRNTVTDTTFIRPEKNVLSGSLKQYATGYPAWDLAYLKKYHEGKDLDDRVRYMLMRGSDKFTQVKYELKTSEKGNKDASLTASFQLEDYSENIGEDYIVNMNLENTYSNLRMNDSERKVGYYFPCKEKIKEVVVLDIPEGYTVTHLPPDAHGGVDDVWSYKISYTANKKQVVLTKEFETRSLSMSATDFKNNNRVIDQLNIEYRKSVVLTAKKKSGNRKGLARK